MATVKIPLSEPELNTIIKLLARECEFIGIDVKHARKRKDKDAIKLLSKDRSELRAILRKLKSKTNRNESK